MEKANVCERVRKKKMMKKEKLRANEVREKRLQ